MKYTIDNEIRRIFEEYIHHYYCEDSWYSCPKATDGCGNEEVGKKCNCGRDEKIEQLTIIFTDKFKEILKKYDEVLEIERLFKFLDKNEYSFHKPLIERRKEIFNKFGLNREISAIGKK